MKLNQFMRIQVKGALIFSLLVSSQIALALSEEEKLGKILFKDKDLSVNRNQSCETCHSLKPIQSLEDNILGSVSGFVDPLNIVEGTPVSIGSILSRQGTINAPTVGYAAFTPAFHWDESQGIYIGGQFLNGRASTLEEQAKMPFLNPVEMAMPNKWSVIERLKQKKRYRKLFRRVYGINLKSIPSPESINDDEAPAKVDIVFNYLADAISAFERTRKFNKFTSKFDFYKAGMTDLSEIEEDGLNLFEGRANCSLCHISEPTTSDNGYFVPPLFTMFGYDNLGFPHNVNIAGNPEPDLGLGGRQDIAEAHPSGDRIGKQKIQGLRNIALTPPYGHNGVFTTLEQVVKFYNTRDVLGHVENNNSEEFGITGWPGAAVPQNVNSIHLGNLGLTDYEESAIVAFLKTLTDNYPKWGNDPKVPKGSKSPYRHSLKGLPEM